MRIPTCSLTVTFFAVCTGVIAGGVGGSVTRADIGFPDLCDINYMKLPGTFCQPRVDETDLSYVNHAVRLNSADSPFSELVCPFPTLAEYPAEDHVEDGLEVVRYLANVYDPSGQEQLYLSACRNLDGSSEARVCGEGVATGKNFVGWTAVDLSGPQPDLEGDRHVYFLRVVLPSGGILHSYAVLRGGYFACF
ncbi:MAG: hypothetical protein AB7P00_04430 [Sandaracinaceae bacterium]